MFLLESYVSRTDPGAAGRLADRARCAADELLSEGTLVSLRDSIFVPEDELLLLLYEADSAEAVRLASGRACLPFERITPAVAERKRQMPATPPAHVRARPLRIEVPPMMGGRDAPREDTKT